MKQFDWESFVNGNKHKLVHCRTEEEAIDFCRKMHEHGLTWSSGKSYLDVTHFNENKSNTCYSNKGTYGRYEDYRDGVWKVFEWSDYMDNENIMGHWMK